MAALRGVGFRSASAAIEVLQAPLVHAPGVGGEGCLGLGHEWTHFPQIQEVAIFNQTWEPVFLYLREVYGEDGRGVVQSQKEHLGGGVAQFLIVLQKQEFWFCFVSGEQVAALVNGENEGLGMMKLFLYPGFVLSLVCGSVQLATGIE